MFADRFVSSITTSTGVIEHCVILNITSHVHQERVNDILNYTYRLDSEILRIGKKSYVIVRIRCRQDLNTILDWCDEHRIIILKK